MRRLKLLDRMEEGWKGCQRCDLSRNRNRIVHWRGNPEAPLVLIGEAPGEEEDARGRPFVGPAGRTLDALLKEAGLSNEHVFIVNTVACFPGEVLISGSDAGESFRRPFTGELIRIKTAKNVLSGTPNHPILTRRGWVPLKFVVKGDHLVRSHFAERMRGCDPNVDWKPTRFEEFFDARSVPGIRQRVGITNVDFHGDGMLGEVDVVGAHRKLLGEFKTTPLDELVQLVLEAANKLSGFSHSLGSSLQHLCAGFGGSGLPTYGVVGTGDQPLTRFAPHALQTKRQGFTFVSQRNAKRREFLPQGALPYADFIGERLQSLSGLVSFDQVCDSESVSFSGHVYNVSTARQWYTANGFVVHNCRPPADRWPEPEEIKACSMRLQIMLRIVRPRALLLLGATAAHLSGVQSVSANRGDVTTVDMLCYDGEVRSWPAIVTWHPAFVMRAGHHRKPFQEALEDIRAAWKLTEFS